MLKFLNSIVCNFLSKNKERISVFFMLVIIVTVTGYPYLKNGLSGHYSDLMYHLLRIESVKDAIMVGEYPAKIYSMFFNGYGYGSPMFYPDIFLLFPAILRVLGISPILTWKIFALSITCVATCTTYLSFKYICKRWDYALAGTFLLMLSQFYLADLLNRVGISEYIAYIFIPVLIAGIYDYFVYQGKKMWLMGIAFVGLLLSHTIMTFIGLVICFVIFAFMLIFSRKRKEYFSIEKLKKLCFIAGCTLLSVCYYLIPMFEQMVSNELQYATPWARVGEFVQPISTLFLPTGYFHMIAYVGIGMPILSVLGLRFLISLPQDKWTDIFFFGGIVLFAMTTKLFPWKLFNNTIVNSIQFPYRLYPYALCFLVLGIILVLCELSCVKSSVYIVVFVIATSIVFGVWQNSALAIEPETLNIDEDYLIERSNIVGAGEWLPVDVKEDVRTLQTTNFVINKDSNAEIKWNKEETGYSFSVETIDAEYEVPLIYYKGYQAILVTEGGEEYSLELTKSDESLIEIHNDTQKSGTVYVWYKGTVLQKVSECISLVTVVSIIAWCIYNSTKVKRLKKRKAE